MPLFGNDLLQCFLSVNHRTVMVPYLLSIVYQIKIWRYITKNRNTAIEYNVIKQPPNPTCNCLLASLPTDSFGLKLSVWLSVEKFCALEFGWSFSYTAYCFLFSHFCFFMSHSCYLLHFCLKCHFNWRIWPVCFDNACVENIQYIYTTCLPILQMGHKFEFITSCLSLYIISN